MLSPVASSPVNTSLSTNSSLNEDSCDETFLSHVKSAAASPPRLLRAWSMPNASTFAIPPVRALLSRWMPASQSLGRWIDPFAGNSPVRHLCVATNDLDLTKITTQHLESLEFLRSFADAQGLDGILFDPPRSSAQISEALKKAGVKPSQQDTQGSWLSARRMGAAFVLKVGGVAICAGHNSGGLGQGNGCELLVVLLVAHGSNCPDTIVTVERKVRETVY